MCPLKIASPHKNQSTVMYLFIPLINALCGDLETPHLESVAAESNRS